MSIERRQAARFWAHAHGAPKAVGAAEHLAEASGATEHTDSGVAQPTREQVAYVSEIMGDYRKGAWLDEEERRKREHAQQALEAKRRECDMSEQPVLIMHGAPNADGATEHIVQAEERRQAADGKYYTYAEFTDHYRTNALRKWYQCRLMSTHVQAHAHGAPNADGATEHIGQVEERQMT